MSTERARGPISHARHAAHRPAAQAVREDLAASVPADAIEFVRFCYRRRRVSWPALYDEMCAVASRGAFRGLGYAELTELGISFCLTDLPKLAAATEIVMADERGGRDGYGPEPGVPMTLAAQPTG